MNASAYRRKLQVWVRGIIHQITTPNTSKSQVPEGYAQMLREAAEMPLLEIAKAKVCNALTLYGYLVFPFTFPALRNSRTLQDIGKTGTVLLTTVQHVPLLWSAGVLCVLGSSGIASLWWRWRNSYVWLLASIIMYVVRIEGRIRLLIEPRPNMWNAALSLTTTLLGVYNAQHWSTLAVITTTITSLFTVGMLIAAIVYNTKLMRERQMPVGRPR